MDTVASHSTNLTSSDMPGRNALSAHTVKSLEERQEDGMSVDASLSATTLDTSLTMTACAGADMHPRNSAFRTS